MKYATVVLSGTYSETAPQTRSLLNASAGQVFRFDRFLARVEYILARKKIGRVLVEERLDFRCPHTGAVEEVRRQLERLVRAGKEVYFFARTYDALQLYLASACPHRIIDPLGTIRFGGVARSFLFFRRIIDKYELKVEIVRRGRYKSAGDPYRVENLDDYNREQYEAVLDVLLSELSDKVVAGFHMERSELDELLAGKVLAAQAAVERKWIERACTKAALVADWRKEKLAPHETKKIGRSFGKGQRIALLFFEGAIIDGESRRDPMMGQMIGSESFVPIVERLARDKRVRGVVLRVNSPGGSATASEEIADSLTRLAEKKPLVVSMGPVAGSGGYWISCPGERIFAERTTLTGSIGVITMLISAREGLRRLGVTESTVRRGDYADLGSPFRAMSEQDRGILDHDVERLYRSFLDHVATTRKRPGEEIESVAEGRVWAGGEAATRGLVDEIGGVIDALAFLKKRLGLRRASVSFYPVVRYSLVQRFIMRNAAAVGSSFSAGPDLGALGLAVFLGSAVFARPLALAPEALADPWHG